MRIPMFVTGRPSCGCRVKACRRRRMPQTSRWKETMKRNYVEVALKTDADSGELLGMLGESGLSGGWEEGGILRMYWPEERWNGTVLESVLGALKRLGAGDAGNAPSVTIVEDQDWNRTWAASLEPIRPGRRLRIRQSWHAPDPSFGGIELVLDPRRAFGTGYHATTQMVLQWLEDTITGGERVLDIGTGSGILSMAALRLGAASALAVDVDADAVECAREYAAANRFGGEIEFRVASFEALDGGGFDAVLANIDGRTLPSLCPHLPRFLKARGAACFSGLQKADYWEISNALKDAGFQIAAHRQMGEWIALEIAASPNVPR